MNAEETLLIVIELLMTNLEELVGIRDEIAKQFQYGEKTAFVECLEVIQLWENAESYGIDFDIEEIFSL